MAGDRHGKHNTTTISFRVNSYEKATIEERVKVSGMKKQDYIVRSCIYNQVCVVGKKETIEIIRSEMKEMSLVLEDVAKDLKSEKPVISEPVLDSMTERYLAFLEAALWMLKGSSYLWEDKKDGKYLSWDMLFKKSYYATARDELEKNKDSMNELEGIGKNL